MRSATFLLLLALLAGCDSPAPYPAKPELDVMSFNIRYGTARDGKNAWKKRSRLVFEVFRHHDPDIAGLQEVMKFQQEELLAALPEYAAVGRGRDADGRGERCTILYRKNRFIVRESGTFWLSVTPDKPGSRSWDSAITRICTWVRFETRADAKPFYVLNTHFDHRGKKARHESAKIIAGWIQTREHRIPVLLTGDFNAGENSPPITALSEFQDTFRAVHPDRTDTGTFNGFRGKHDGPRIDYIFCTSGLTVLDADILRDNENGRYPSDHNPVTARVRLP